MYQGLAHGDTSVSLNASGRWLSKFWPKASQIWTLLKPVTSSKIVRIKLAAKGKGKQQEPAVILQLGDSKAAHQAILCSGACDMTCTQGYRARILYHYMMLTETMLMCEPL